MANTNPNQVRLLMTLTVTPIQEAAPATHIPPPGRALVTLQLDAADMGSIPVQISPAQPTAPDRSLPTAESEPAETGFDMNELLYHEEDNVQQPSDEDWMRETCRLCGLKESLRSDRRSRNARAIGVIVVRPANGYARTQLEMVYHVEHSIAWMLYSYSFMRRREPVAWYREEKEKFLQRYPRLYAMVLHLRSTLYAQMVAEFPDREKSLMGSHMDLLELTREMLRYSNLVNTLLPPSTYSQEFPKTYAFSLRHPATEKDEARARPGDYRGGITFPLTPTTHILTAVRTVFAMLHEYCDKRDIQHKWTLELGPERAPDGDDSGDEGDSRGRKRARIE